MKLNLGCSNQHLDGYINVDCERLAYPDQLVDLEDFPWPWPDQSVDEIVACHVLEHLGAKPQDFMQIMQELYRIMKPDALLHITVPHPRSDNFIADPTHVRPILPMTMRMFSKRLCEQSQKEGGATTPLALYLDVDFEIEGDQRYGLSDWGAALPEHVRMKAMETQYNICTEISMTLRRI